MFVLPHPLVRQPLPPGNNPIAVNNNNNNNNNNNLLLLLLLLHPVRRSVVTSTVSIT